MGMYLAAALFVAVSQFDVQSIAVSGKDSRIILAGIGGGPGGDVVVVEGSRLLPYSGATLEPYGEIALEPGASCFDFADLDGDGTGEVVAIAGERVLRYAVPARGQAAPPAVELFRVPSLLSGAEQEPFPYVLTTVYEGKPVITIPTEKGLELRAPDGTPVIEVPTRPGTGGSYLYKQAVSGKLAAEDAIEFSVSQYSDSALELPEVLRMPARAWGQTYGAAYRGRDPVEEWPWFPLNTSREVGGPRVHFVFDQPKLQETHIRIETFSTPAGEPDAKVVSDFGPLRRYPGQAIVSYDEWPDFNGDGYIDLALWRSPIPGMSADTLTRALSGGIWNVDFLIHLYSPGDSRYEPAPAANIDILVPVTRFLNYGYPPFGEWTFNDFNGDGRSDFGCSMRRNRFAIWLYGDAGMPKKPDFDQTFSGDISLTFRADLDGSGRTAIGLRTEKELFVVRMER